MRDQRRKLSPVTTRVFGIAGGHQKRSTAEVLPVGDSFISSSAEKQEKRNKSRLTVRTIF